MIKNRERLNKIAADLPVASTVVGAGTGALATILARRLLGGNMGLKDYLLWGGLGLASGGTLGAMLGSDPGKSDTDKAVGSADGSGKGNDGSGKGGTPDPGKRYFTEKAEQLTRYGIANTLAAVSSWYNTPFAGGRLWGAGWRPGSIDRVLNKIHQPLVKNVNNASADVADARVAVAAASKNVGDPSEASKAVQDYDSKLSKAEDTYNRSVATRSEATDNYNKAKSDLVKTDSETSDVLTKAQRNYAKELLNDSLSDGERTQLRKIVTKLVGKDGNPRTVSQLDAADLQLLEAIRQRRAVSVLESIDKLPIIESARKSQPNARLNSAKEVRALIDAHNAANPSNQILAKKNGKLYKLLDELDWIESNKRVAGVDIPAPAQEYMTGTRHDVQSAEDSVTGARKHRVTELKGARSEVREAKRAVDDANDAVLRAWRELNDIKARDNGSGDIAALRQKRKAYQAAVNDLAVKEAALGKAQVALENAKNHTPGVETRVIRDKNGKIIESGHRGSSATNLKRLGVTGAKFGLANLAALLLGLITDR